MKIKIRLNKDLTSLLRKGDEFDVVKAMSGGWKVEQKIHGATIQHFIKFENADIITRINMVIKNNPKDQAEALYQKFGEHAADVVRFLLEVKPEPTELTAREQYFFGFWKMTLEELEEKLKT